MAPFHLRPGNLYRIYSHAKLRLRDGHGSRDNPGRAPSDAPILFLWQRLLLILLCLYFYRSLGRQQEELKLRLGAVRDVALAAGIQQQLEQISHQQMQLLNDQNDVSKQLKRIEK